MCTISQVWTYDIVGHIRILRYRTSDLRHRRSARIQMSRLCVRRHRPSGPREDTDGRGDIPGVRCGDRPAGPPSSRLSGSARWVDLSRLRAGWLGSESARRRNTFLRNRRKQAPEGLGGHRRQYAGFGRRSDDRLTREEPNDGIEAAAAPRPSPGAVRAALETPGQIMVKQWSTGSLARSRTASGPIPAAGQMTGPKNGQMTL
jgi:hypothetical protein